MKPCLINGTSIGQYIFIVSLYFMLLFWIQGVEGEYKGVYSPLSENFHEFPSRRGRIVFQDIVGGPLSCHGFTAMHVGFILTSFAIGWVACFLWLLFGSGE